MQAELEWDNRGKLCVQTWGAEKLDSARVARGWAVSGRVAWLGLVQGTVWWCACAWLDC